MVQRVIAVACVVLSTVGMTACGVTTVGPEDSTDTREAPITTADGGASTGATQAIVAASGEGAACAAWESVRDRYTQVPTWSAGDNQCNPGALPDAARHASLAWVNLYRSFAGLAPVAELAADRAPAQACAVMLERNGQLSHTPPAAWSCATEAARLGAARSNLSGNPGFPMSPWYSTRGWIDEGRDLADDLGHRRWLLSPELSTATYGQTGSFACLTLGLGTRDPRAPRWVAWPPAGWVPTALVGTTWSFSQPGVTAAGTAVLAWRDGAAMVVTARARQAGYGDDTVSWEVPSASVGSVYRVRVTVPGSAAVEYEVRPTGCARR